MKKLLVVAVVLVALGLLPLVGNKVVRQTIENRIDVLNSYGVTASLDKEEKSYLNTHLHYTLKVTDEEKFLLYLQQFSSKQLPPYTTSLLEGVEVGVDVDYSNLPFKETIAIDMYPQKLSPVTMQELKKKSKSLYQSIQKILASNAILYHIDYEAVSGEFVWYMKDFNQEVKVDADTILTISYNGIKGHGKGILVAPEMLSSTIKNIHFKADTSEDIITFDMENIDTTTNFESKTTYISTFRMAKLRFAGKSKRSNAKEIHFDIDDVTFNGSLNTQQKDAQIFAKMDTKKILFYVNGMQYKAQNFTYEISLKGIDKKSFIKVQQLVEKQELSSKEQQELKDALETIAVKGLKLQIPNLLVEKLSIRQQKMIDGFDLKLDAKLPASPSNKDIDKLINNILLKADITLSKELYTLVSQLTSARSALDKVKKEQNNKVIFHIEVKNGNSYINGERL